MNIFFRVLLAIYAFCLALISAIAMLIIIKPPILDSIYFYIVNNIMINTSILVLLFVVSFIIFVLSIMFLFSGIKSSKDKKAVSKYTNMGEIRISLNSIENIVLNTARKLNGVREPRASVAKVNGNVTIIIKVVVMPDINIPAISEDMQNKVKKSVEETTGINVNDVKVIVDGIYQGATFKPRVE